MKGYFSCFSSLMPRNVVNPFGCLFLKSSTQTQNINYPHKVTAELVIKEEKAPSNHPSSLAKPLELPANDNPRSVPIKNTPIEVESDTFNIEESRVLSSSDLSSISSSPSGSFSETTKLEKNNIVPKLRLEKNNIVPKLRLEKIKPDCRDSWNIDLIEKVDFNSRIPRNKITLRQQFDDFMKDDLSLCSNIFTGKILKDNFVQNYCISEIRSKLNSSQSEVREKVLSALYDNIPTLTDFSMEDVVNCLEKEGDKNIKNLIIEKLKSSFELYSDLENAGVFLLKKPAKSVSIISSQKVGNIKLFFNAEGFNEDIMTP